MTELVLSCQFGDIVVRLDTARAPATSKYFLDLVRDNAFDNASIFRIVAPSNHDEQEPNPIHVVQIGTGRGFAWPHSSIEHETTRRTGILHKKWTISAARFDARTVYGSFFICMRDEPCLDFGGKRQEDGQGYAAFGHAVSGFDVLETISEHAESSELLTAPLPISVTLRKTQPIDRERSDDNPYD